MSLSGRNGVSSRATRAGESSTGKPVRTAHNAAAATTTLALEDKGTGAHETCRRKTFSSLALFITVVGLLTVSTLVLLSAANARTEALSALVAREADFRARALHVSMEAWRRDAVAFGRSLAAVPTMPTAAVRHAFEHHVEGNGHLLSMAWAMRVNNSPEAIASWTARTLELTGCTEESVFIKAPGSVVLPPELYDPASLYLISQTTYGSTVQEGCSVAVGFDLFSLHPANEIRRSFAQLANSTRESVAMAPVATAPSQVSQLDSVSIFQALFTPVYADDGGDTLVGIVSSAFAGQNMLSASGAAADPDSNFDVVLVDVESGVVMSGDVASNAGSAWQASRDLTFGRRTWRLTVRGAEDFGDLVPNRDTWVSVFALFLALCVTVLVWTRAREETVVLRALTRLLHQMSHDLRAPLHAISGCAEQLSDVIGIADDTHAQELLRTVGWCGSLARAIVDNILDMKHIAQGRFVMADARCADVVQSLHAALNIVTAIASDGGTRLEYDGPASSPCAVMVDEEKLMRTVINVLGNAVKFAAGGHIKLRARIVQGPGDAVDGGEDSAVTLSTAAGVQTAQESRSPAPAAAVTAASPNPNLAPPAPGMIRFDIAVEDNGVGMDAHTLAHATRPYVHAAKSTGGGSGIGLHINRKVVRYALKKLNLIAEEHVNGAVALERLKALTLLGRGEAGTAMGAGAGAGASGGGDGAGGRRVFALMDIRMPELNGDEATMAYRSWAEAQEPPIPREEQVWICAITGDVVSTAATFSAHGFDACLSKPCGGDTLRRTVSTAMAARG